MALGISKRHEEVRATANTSAIEASPVGLGVQALVEVCGAFEGTAIDLLRALSRHKNEAVNPRAWPDSPWKLSNTLRRLAPHLRLVGIEVAFCKDSDRKRSRLIKLTGRASAPSGASGITTYLAEMRTHADAPTTSSDGACNEQNPGNLGCGRSGRTRRAVRDLFRSR